MSDGSLPGTRGIVDRESGLKAGVDARKEMIRLARRVVGDRLDFDVAQMTMLSLLTRAQAFHDAAVEAIRADNPFAAFTLLRSYSENAAMLNWLRNKPLDIARIYPDADRSQAIRVGQLTNNTDGRFGAFKPIYEQLSHFVHPGAATALAGWHASDRPDHVSWGSAPAFKNQDDLLMACFWLVELAEANGHLWGECWQMYFGPGSAVVLPEWGGKSDEGDADGDS